MFPKNIAFYGSLGPIPWVRCATSDVFLNLFCILLCLFVCCICCVYCLSQIVWTIDDPWNLQELLTQVTKVDNTFYPVSKTLNFLVASVDVNF